MEERRVHTPLPEHAVYMPFFGRIEAGSRVAVEAQTFVEIAW